MKALLQMAKKTLEPIGGIGRSAMARLYVGECPFGICETTCRHKTLHQKTKKKVGTALNAVIYSALISRNVFIVSAHGAKKYRRIHGQPSQGVRWIAFNRR